MFFYFILNNKKLLLKITVKYIITEQNICLLINMTNLDFSHCEFNIQESEFKLIYNLPYNIPKLTFINGNFDFYLKKN